MDPSEARAEILAQHDELRALVRNVARALDAAEGEEGGSDETIRLKIATLATRLVVHMVFEEGLLAPILEEVDEWGPQRRREYEAMHEQQRAWMARILDDSYSCCGRDLRTTARELVEVLTADMDDEEATVLDDKLLRDDLVVIDQSGG